MATTAGGPSASTANPGSPSASAAHGGETGSSPSAQKTTPDSSAPAGEKASAPQKSGEDILGKPSAPIDIQAKLENGRASVTIVARSSATDVTLKI